MSEANPTLDPIGYRCDGCGRLFKDPYADLSAIRAAGGRSCCPERKPVGLSDRIEELEAKLAKAVEALVRIADTPSEMTWGVDSEVREAMNGMEIIAETALAELTSSEAANGEHRSRCDLEAKGGKNE